MSYFKNFYNYLSEYRKILYLIIIVTAFFLETPDFINATASKLQSTGKEFVIPWVIITIFLIPSTLSGQYIIYLLNIKNIDGISDEKRKQLNNFINLKFVHVKLSITLYIILANFIIGLFLFYTNNISNLSTTLMAVSACSILSTIDLIFVLQDIKDIHDERSEIIEEIEQDKRSAARIDKVNQ
jgi:hypothetical protein